jgi:hypothetical protein
MRLSRKTSVNRNLTVLFLHPNRTTFREGQKYYVDWTGLRRKLVKGKGKVTSQGLSTFRPLGPIVFLPPTSSRIHLQRRHATYRCARPLPAKSGTITKRILLGNLEFTKFTRIFYMPQSWDMGQIILLPSEGRHTEDFPDARKIQRLRPGLKPQTRVPVASMLTTRPPKPSKNWYMSINEHMCQ